MVSSRPIWLTLALKKGMAVCACVCVCVYVHVFMHACVCVGRERERDGSEIKGTFCLPEDLGSNPTLTWHFTTMYDSSFRKLTPLLPSVGTAHVCTDMHARQTLN